MSKPLGNAVFRFVPALDSLRTYSPVKFRRDLVAGMTVATVAVPQAMAYATIFGMPVELGLYTAIVMTMVGALLDSSRQLINGPTNVISIAMLSALAAIPVDPPERRVEAAIMMASMIGLIQIGITAMRLGDLSRYISHSVITGFTVGASVLLVLDQMKNALGLSSKGDIHDPFLKRFYLTMTEGGSIHWPTLWVTVGTMAVALAFRFLNRRFRLAIPELFLAVCFAATAAWLFQLGPVHKVKLVETIPQSLPTFQLPRFDLGLARELFGSALAIALLGLLEAIAMAKSIAVKSKQKLDINQQCLSEGVANFVGGFFRCFPGSGSLTRSYINQQAGAETQWSGVFCAMFVGLIVMVLAPFAQFIPRPALSAVLFLAASRMVDIEGLVRDMKATRFDALIIIVTAIAAVAISIEFCILIGVVLSFFIYVPRAAQISMTSLVLGQNRVIRERLESDVRCDRLLVYSLEGEMFFGASPDLEKLLDQIESEVTDHSQVIVLRLRYARNPDSVCLNLIKQFIAEMKKRGLIVLLAGVRQDMLKIMKNLGIVELVGEENLFREEPKLWTSTFEAIQRAYQILGDERCATCPQRRGVGGGADTDSAWHFSI